MFSKSPHAARTNDGEYFTSFFLIRMDRPMRDGMRLDELFSAKEGLATFTHEYLHFLQDVTTTGGLSRFINFSKFIQTGIAGITKHESPVLLPYNPYEFDEQDAGDVMYLEGYYFGDGAGDEDYKVIRHLHDVKLERDCILDDMISSSEDIRAVHLYYDDNPVPYAFGSDCVRESISYLIEHLKCGAALRRNELPYNSCELVCEYLYPELAERKDVLVFLAERSLMHYDSGREFYEFISEMKQRQAAELPLYEIKNLCLRITPFLEEDFNRACQEINNAIDFLYPPCAPFSDANARLKKIFYGGIRLHEICPFPMSQFLQEDDILSYLKFLTNTIGLPLLADNQYQIFSEGNNLSHFMVPIAVYHFLFYIKSECFIYPYCKAEGCPCLNEEYCQSVPWKQVTNKDNQVLCPFAAFWHHYSLSGKEIKRRL